MAAATEAPAQPAQDPPSFEHFYERRRRVVVWALHKAGYRGEYEDATQEVFLRFWKNWARYGVAHPSAQTVLIRRVARTVAIDERRAGEKRPALSPEPEAHRLGLLLVPDPGPTPEAALALKELGATVRALLGELPPQQQRVLRLLYLRDLKPREIAALLGVTPGAVYLARKFGLAALRRKLRQERGR